MPTPLATDRAAIARAAHIRRAAERAAADPAQRARAVRIVGAALSLRLLTAAEVIEAGQA